MMHVQEFLKAEDDWYKEWATLSYSDIKCTNFKTHSLEVLKESYGIKYNIWEDKLVVLNYDQIESSSYKFHPIVRECRSLVLELGTWEVVSRSFDRFFNYGEDPDCEDKVEDLVAFEKVDGSLISLFNYQGEWLYRTKSMIMPDTVINDNIDGVTWGHAIEYALSDVVFSDLYKDITYILELVCKQNRVVVDYGYKFPVAYLLKARWNTTGKYVGKSTGMVKSFYELNGVFKPKKYKFDTLDHCLQSAKELRNLEEGYVMYNKVGEPVMKVKNPAYVAAHHLRGNGPLTEKRVLDIILMNEQDEYLSIFPEDEESFRPYLDANAYLDTELDMVTTKVNSSKNLTQKEFALRVKDKPVASIYFKVRQGKTVQEAWEELTENSKRNMILAYKL